MRRVNKDIALVPGSIALPLVGATAIPPITTHTRRLELIVAEAYADEAIYNSRYKQADVKQALNDIYKRKCAFCEQRAEQSHVEHYRPKKTYYWLVYSWDNLILACPTCNQNKGTNFDRNGALATFTNSLPNIQNIHNSSVTYDALELPLMVNPEITDPAGLLQFQKNGLIESEDARFSYTITICKLDRPDLNDQRRALLNAFKEDIKSVLLENKNENDQQIGIKTIVSKFVRDSINVDSPFLAFKKFAIDSGWLNEIVKELN